MKKISLFIISICIFLSCSDFLDTEDLTQKNSSNFPQTSEDVYSSLLSAYAAIGEIKDPFWQTFFLLAEIMSDDRFGGGSTVDRMILAVNEYKKSQDNMYSGIWSKYYRGIYRTHFVMENIDRVPWGNEVQKNKILGQAHFLRAYMYFDLCRLFGTVPLVLSTQVESVPKASPEELYACIFSDLKKAIELLPSVRYQDISDQEKSLATKWAAQALLAKAYLFYSGYYKAESIRLSDQTVLNKEYVVSNIDDCIANSGHGLISDYRNLWPYSISNKEYGYARDNQLEWIGENGDNIETVFAWKYSPLGNGFSNKTNLYFGIKGQDQIPFGKGWGFGTVNPMLYTQWPDDDIRKKASIYNVEDPEEGTTGFIWNGENNQQETGYWQKKYMPVNVRNAAGNVVNYSCELYGATTNFQENNTQDLVVIRFADVLLMGAELGSAHAQSYLDQVRKRVGLPSVPVTLENIKKERRYELAFEGIRYYDLLRWGDAEKEINKIVNVPARTMNVPMTVTVKFRPETGGFLPIPENEILLSNGVLEQNPGWTGSDALY
ncbi:RagB/SusD family nutrient uptake outer membrane protein [uncultured Parabacteroides sp.]|uniref:RagB/SusD family nutrient uptake outer membrane protein n=1 Tax=uncultured Parabacteroides sp. TaxID=512312 RepID=UPI0025CC66D3|nr:RagB/SusD family nutrient uptake outer membrane protein [uncultured Parabacteroides sp.]